MTVYATCLPVFLAGGIDVVGDDLKAQCVTASYVPDLTDTGDAFLSDIPTVALAGPAHLVTNVSVNAGVVSADPVDFVGMTLADPVKAIVLYRSTGSDATSNLIAYYDRRADTRRIARVIDSTTERLTWNGLGLLHI